MVGTRRRERDDGEDGQQDQQPSPGPPCKREQWHEKDRRRDNDDDRAVALNTDGSAQTLDPMARGCPVADRPFKGSATGSEQIIARVGAPPIGRAIGDLGGACCMQRRHCNFDLG